MSKTVAEHQREYRQRKAERFARMQTGYADILAAIEGKTGPVADRVRAIVEEATR